MKMIPGGLTERDLKELREMPKTIESKVPRSGFREESGHLRCNLTLYAPSDPVVRFEVSSVKPSGILRTFAWTYLPCSRQGAWGHDSDSLQRCPRRADMDTGWPLRPAAHPLPDGPKSWRKATCSPANSGESSPTDTRRLRMLFQSSFTTSASRTETLTS